MKKLTLAFLLGTFICSPALAAKSMKAWSLSKGIETPESAYYDPASRSLFISNIAGEGNKKDGRGWISRLTSSGKVISAKWVKGLNAPKGMRSFGNTLWVSDIDEVVKINISKAKIEKRIKVPGAKFLNDVAADFQGRVYVSDTTGSQIFKIENDKVSVFVSGKKWESPNGLLVDGNDLIVAAWGFVTDFSQPASGHLYKIDTRTKKKTLISKHPLGNLDGLELDPSKKSKYILSDWVKGTVFRVAANGSAGAPWTLEKGAADIALIPTGRTGLVVIPSMMKNEVRTVSIDKLSH